MSNDDRSRREFLAQASAVGAALSTASSALAKSGSKSSSARSGARVIGANDRINVGVIGVGGRGSGDARKFAEVGAADNSCQVVAIADCYQKRINRNKEALKITDGYLDFREILNRKDIDAVVVATPDHWHARIALEAMDHGKDVYLEKPMCHTIEEARQLVNTVKETGRVLQVGSQTTSADQWWKAKKAIADGMIGKMIMSQGSYHRNSVNGEWNYTIDPKAGPEGTGEDFVDWKMWLGSAPKRAWDADRFFRFRKYWDYSGGIATDLFYHVAAPLNICWDKPQYPTRVVGSGGIYGGPAFEEKREVPDTFHLLAEYPEGHSVVLSSSMANSQHIPGLIRGHHGTIIMVENGQFEGRTDNITLRPETHMVGRGDQRHKEDLFADYKFGVDEQKIPVDQYDSYTAHVKNFLSCMRTRKKPTLDVETGACAQVLISLSVDSYRQGKVLYFDEKKWKVSDKPVKA
ncbi:MAG TPA: Gfo/Idh/MocA family oxidoreductase [Bryobacteraceae bacterium]|nr:Gfo/Idh/MocA family oxidoreductase [Bryobacteraceae bacterium]